MDTKNITSSNVPIVLKNALKWGICDWDLDKWKTFLEKDQESKKFTFRKGKKCCSEEPFWERMCDNVQMTLSDFFGKHMTREDENGNWLYFDYKHIGEWFSSIAENLDISWEDFGYPEKTAKDSTIWIGTKGAHTPCHLDTYGCNLVAQIYGRKEWYLFPPSESESLKPTRVPYEESSIYSSLNFACGCSNVSGIKDVRVVVLNPGDVLFVPYHWWHYVENVSPAISINVWIPTTNEVQSVDSRSSTPASQALDEISRLEESLVKYFITSVCRSVEKSDINDILNPNEDDIPLLKENYNIEELSLCIKHCSNTDSAYNENNGKTDLDIAVSSITADEFYHILKPKCINLIDFLNCAPFEKQEKHLRIDIIKAFCHPDVISLVRKKLLNLKK